MNQVNDFINQRFGDHDVVNMSDDSSNSEPLCEWNCLFWTTCWTIPSNDHRNVSSKNLNWFNGRFNSPDLNNLCDITVIHFSSCKVLLWLKFMKTLDTGQYSIKIIPQTQPSFASLSPFACILLQEKFLICGPLSNVDGGLFSVFFTSTRAK